MWKPPKKNPEKLPLSPLLQSSEVGRQLIGPTRIPCPLARPLRIPSEGSPGCAVSDRRSPRRKETRRDFIEFVMADELPMNCRTPAITEYNGTMDSVEHLARFENAALLYRYTDGIKCRVFVTTFARAAQQWFNQLPAGAIGSFQEFRSLFLHQFASSRKLRKTELSLCRAIKGQRAFEGVFTEIQCCCFGVSKFDALLARATKYINMEDAQAAKKESRWEKRKDSKEEIPSKKPRTEFKERKAPYQRINAVYTLLTVPISQALMAVEGKGLLARPRS
ncbi:UNVERIFIED_CONTAM: hypothetical protein Slati_3084500 [Sesamum latifolium]|uniref:Retrotransposon gag domain-containing protein n=1 Tax=Sesamum latifolium TaxID=2727402 RepID=A0AAW2UX05_9LAMI